MTFIKTRILLSGLLLLSTATGFAQSGAKKKTPAAQEDPSVQKGTVPDASAKKAAPAKDATADKPVVPDQAEAYYHFSLAHMYEEMMAMYGRSEYANKAIDEYRLALENDPSSEYLNTALAELYAKTGRIRDAVVEEQDMIKRDPN